MTNDTLIDEHELREVLRPLRPQPGAYEDAVLEKLVTREKRLALLQRSPFLRQVAALLPPGVAPMVPVAATGKKLAAQLSATLVAMPVLVLAMTGITFVAGLRSLRRLDARNIDDDGPLVHAKRWWRAHPIAILIVVGLFMVLGFTQHIDLLLGVIVLSMLALIWVLRRLSEAGVAGRSQIGGPCGYMLFMLAMGVTPVRHLLGIQQAELQGFLAYLFLFTAGIVCFVSSIPAGGATKSGITRAGALVAFLPLFALVIGLQLFGFSRQATGMTRAELVEYAESVAPDPGDSHEWCVLREVALWLEETGTEALDLTPARVEFRDALNRGEDLSNFVLGDAADLGWIEDEDWPAILEERRSRRLLEGSGSIPFLRQSHATLHGFVESRGLSEAERNHLADRLVATWTDAESFAQLETLVEIVRDLELIDRGDRLAGLAPVVRSALIEAWMPEGAARESDGGGFVAYYRRDRNYASVRATLAAIRLMRRFGVPDPIDLTCVQGYLRTEAIRYVERPASSIHVEEALALASLEHHFVERLPEEPAPTVLTFLLNWRLTIGVFLLSGLCVYATLRAPVE